jgi:5-methyltetrahydropteroyltriglutamate--homocysteine methyltransferase
MEKETLKLPLLPTTTVGSFPKPDELKKARSRFAKGEISKEALEEEERKATRGIIAFQEKLGLDILVDGEMYRGDMATFFAENLSGCKISGLVRSYGNRYYRKPVVIGPLKWPGPITVNWWKFAQSLTKKPVKGMLTGPYTMMDWSFNEYYPNRRETALAFAEVIAQEAVALQDAGAVFIQIDEPAVSTKPEELPLAIEALGIVTKNLKAKTISHMCYGDFALLYPKLLELPVDQLDLELANSDYALLEYFKKYPFTKEIGLGVLDVHNHKIETKDQVKERLHRALSVLSPEKIYVDPDCGLKTRTLEECEGKLRAMVDAVKEVRAELMTPAG